LKTLNMPKLAALFTGVALAFSFPAVGVANKGGVPNSHSKPCPHKGKGSKKKHKNRHGKHCGHR
jgi:hypothetical protein